MCTSLIVGFTRHRLYVPLCSGNGPFASEETQITQHLFPSLHHVCLSVAGSCSLVALKPLLSTPRTFHCSSRCTRWLNRNKTMVVTKQVQSLLSTFEHFTNNIVNVRCYVLNQTTVVPKYYVHMANVSVTFCYTGSFIGNQTYAPMFNCLCVYVKCTSFKLCVYEYERLCNHTSRKQWIIIIFGGIRLCSFKLCCIFSCPCHSFADFCGVSNPFY